MIRILILVFLVGCGYYEKPDDKDPLTNTAFPNPRIKHEIDEGLRNYFDAFMKDADLYGVNTDLVSKLRYMKFGETEAARNDRSVGICSSYGDEEDLMYTTILISDSLKTSPIQLRAVVYHELGHCVLRMEHSPQSPPTIMSPMMSSEIFYKRNWDRLVRNLFTGESIPHGLASAENELLY